MENADLKDVYRQGERLGIRQALFFLGKLGMFRWRCTLNKKVKSSMSISRTPLPTWRSPVDKLTAVVDLYPPAIRGIITMTSSSLDAPPQGLRCVICTKHLLNNNKVYFLNFVIREFCSFNYGTYAFWWLQRERSWRKVLLLWLS
jgi:hypothetical protein